MRRKFTRASRPLLGATAFIVLALTLFVGDFQLGEFHIAPAVMCIGAGLFWSLNPRIDTCLISTFLVFGIVLLADIPKITDDSYYEAVVVVLAFPLLFFSVFKHIEAAPLAALLVSFALAVWFFASLVSLGATIGARTSFVFGPNVMYRIGGALLSVFLFFPYVKSAALNAVRGIGSVMAILIMLYSGSRGAVVLLAFLLALLIYSGRLSKKLVAIGGVAVLVPVVSYGIANIEKLASSLRLFRFALGDASFGRRLDVYNAFPEFIDLGVRRVFFGYPDFVSLAGINPHNIFLEAIYAHGLLFLILLLFGFWFYFRSLLGRIRDPSSSAWVEMPLVCIFMGAMVSGDFYDNYPAICLAFIGIYNFCAQRTRRI